MKKKLLILLTTMLVMLALPAVAHAQIVGSGDCGVWGGDVKWSFDDSGTLTISGTGMIANYLSSPWNEYQDRIKNVIIGDGVTNVGYNAFYRCSSLTDITIPDSVTSIDGSAFQGCRCLADITIPDSVTSIGNYAFYGCLSLKDITIPSGVTSIGDYAFYGCVSLENITIPSGVTSIGDYSFYQCASLKNVKISESVLSIGNETFGRCGSLNICVAENNQNYSDIDGVLFNNNKTILIVYAKDQVQQSYAIPSGVMSIGDNAFKKCTSLTNIKIPDSVMSIGSNAFRDCSSLTEIIIPDSVCSIGNEVFSGCCRLNINVVGNNMNYSDIEGVLFNKDRTEIIAYAKDVIQPIYTIPSGVTSIGNNAFANCASITEITIPSSVTSIGNNAFANCASITGIMIPSGVTNIGNSAFYGCTSIAEITIPSGVMSIGSSTFSDCTSITEITISSGVTSIGNYAFDACSSLTDIKIPESVMGIGEGAFYKCKSLTDVYYSGNEINWSNIFIEEYNDYLLNATIHYNSIINEPVESIIPVALSVERVRGGYVLTADTECEGTAYAAVYDASGALTDVAAVPFKNGTAAVSPNTSGAAKIKFFVWASKLRPITYAETVTY